MRSRKLIGIVALAAIIGAVATENLAAGYVAAIGYVVVIALHNIEFKINRLLDDRRISVPDHEIERDTVG